jgi:cell division protein FtsB
MPPAHNTRFLAEASRKRSQQARQRAVQAVEDAARDAGRPATIVAVADAAAVSRSWLYTQKDLIAAISQLQQRTTTSSRTGRHPATDASLQRRLETALARNKTLREQVTDLTRRLEAAHAEIRRRRATR